MFHQEQRDADIEIAREVVAELAATLGQDDVPPTTAISEFINNPSTSEDDILRLLDTTIERLKDEMTNE